MAATWLMISPSGRLPLHSNLYKHARVGRVPARGASHQRLPRIALGSSSFWRSRDSFQVGFGGVLPWRTAATAAAAFARQRTRGGSAQQRIPSSPSPGSGSDKLERFLSKAGALSRGEARVRVKNGDVTVNGQQVFDPWHLVQVGQDVVAVAGVGEVQLLDWDKRPPSVVLFNKPPDVVVTLNEKDPLLNGKNSLFTALPHPFRDRLAPHVPALRPVGRLDAPTVGLLLFTDSSQLGARLTEPGVCQKEYFVSVSPEPSEASLRELRSGVQINDGNIQRGLTQPCGVDIVRRHKDRAGVVLKFRIEEGRNRQIRRMCDAVGLQVEWLIRMRVGPISLGDLALGEAREATEQERNALLEAAGLR